MSEHRGLRLDAAYAPAENAEAVDHRRVAVRSDDRVRISQHLIVLLLSEDDPREVLQVDLVDDSSTGRCRW